MSLRVYTGEYLVAPYLLHYGGNWCTHDCAYCFANLNKPERTADANDIALLYKWHDVGSTRMEYELLKRGHPILMSNDSDPCAKSNYATFAAVHAASRALGFRLCYQTRGGMEEAQALIVSDAPTTVYVSLTTDDEGTAKRYEPRAPWHAHRMEFIRRLCAAGHHVIAGFNPLVPAWWRDIGACAGRLADMGVAHVWHQAIHISRFQRDAMRASARERVGEEFLTYAMAKRAPDADAYEAALDALRDAGMHLFCGGLSEHGGWWAPYFRKCGFPFSPTLDSWIADCMLVTGGKPALTSLDEFNRWADLGLGRRSVWKDFLMPIGRSLRNAGERLSAVKSQEEVHAYLWRIEDYPSIFDVDVFTRVGTEADGMMCDEHGIPYMAVCSAGFSDALIDPSLVVQGE